MEVAADKQMVVAQSRNSHLLCGKCKDRPNLDIFPPPFEDPAESH
jgi:hypothetical protein